MYLYSFISRLQGLRKHNTKNHKNNTEHFLKMLKEALKAHFDKVKKLTLYDDY